MLAQGFPWILALLSGAARGCELLALVPLAPGLWWVPAVGAETDAVNRGHVAHVLLAREGQRLWALGSGPTPAFGQRLRCTAERQLGAPPSDLVVPWAVAELTLGARGVAARRSWAHRQVAEAMVEQCPHCVERLRQRLGTSAGDLGEAPVSVPSSKLHGAAGRLGPFDWWVLPRGYGRAATVFRHRASGVLYAPGLVWGDGPPDLRDTDVLTFGRSLQALAAQAGTVQRSIGQTGPLLDGNGLLRQARYVADLLAAARREVRAGGLGDAAPPLGGVDHPRHALNWQRAWRQAEDAWLAGR